MQNELAEHAPVQIDHSFHHDNLVLLAIAGAMAVLHIATNGRYGFHRDELQTLSDALHMDWGFVAYPPFTPFVERVGMALFGHFLIGLRMFSVIAQSAVILITGLMAREFGGKRLAQVTAAISVALAPLAMFQGTEFQYSTFDYLWWVLIAYFVVRLLKSDDPRWCVPIGIVIGLGLMTKYTMGFYVAGIVGGLILTRAKRFLSSKWLWFGILLAFLICLPNLIWQLRHDMISLHFLQSIHKRDVGEGRAQGFWRNQFLINTNLATFPLWIAGLIFLLRDRRYRMLVWMYLIPLTLFAATKARFYYLGATYPMLLAMGAVAGERWVSTLRRGGRWIVETAQFTTIAFCAIYISAVIIPWAPSGRLKEFALKRNGDLREEIGWEDLVRNVANIRDQLPPEQQQNFGVVVGNYGEGGAITILGPEYHLPPAIQLTNSGWLRGYPVPPPSTLIVVGWNERQVEEAFTECRVAGRNGNSLGVKNEESESHPDIYVCGPPKQGWVEFWRTHQRFG
ncbi:MAG TPA: glycosyltransferase family 39 protein [Terriglobales bacterium]|nr:glycosyltransferase family 39 protein [Terriglobales bacterium]